MLILMEQTRSLQRIILGIIGATGTAIFAFFFALTFHTPEWVEDFAAGFIEREVAERVDTAIDSVQPPAGDSALSRAAAALYAKNEEKNWLLTILFNDYLGFGYLAYLAVVFALLCDIILNRARVTTTIVNAVLQAVGSVASAVPC